MQATTRSGRELRTRDDTLGSAALKNPEHEKLAREYAAGASMAEAWRAIGRDPSIGNQSRAFRRPEIQDRIAFLRDEWNRLAGISLAALQARLLRIADANVIDLFEADASTKRLRLRDLTVLPRAVTSALAEISIDAKGAVKIKPCDKIHAIDSLIKTIGGFAPDPDGPAGLTLEELILSAGKVDRPTAVKMEVVTGSRETSSGVDVSERTDRPKPKATIWA